MTQSLMSQFVSKLRAQARPIYMPDGSKYAAVLDDTGSWCSAHNDTRRFRVNECDPSVKGGIKLLDRLPVKPADAGDALTEYLAGLGIVPVVAL